MGGIEAEKAFNKFYYLTYEGAIDIQSITDKEELRSIQMQINEFGQTPSQLFTKPHPAKYSVSGSASTSIAVNTMDYDITSNPQQNDGTMPTQQEVEEKKEEPERIMRHRGSADQAAEHGVDYKPNWKYLSSVTSKYECNTIS